jgi:hypothetical protein
VGFLALIQVGFALVLLGFLAFLLLQYVLWGWWLDGMLRRGGEAHLRTTALSEEGNGNGSHAFTRPGLRRFGD